MPYPCQYISWEVLYLFVLRKVDIFMLMGYDIRYI